MAPVLGYWAIRGLAEPIRYLLHHTGTEFTETQYELVGTAPNYSREQWTDVKDKLGLEFPNLPYYIDGDLKLSESGAIMRHIARKHDLAGNTEEEFIRIDVASGVIFDIGFAMARACYSPDFASLKDGLLQAVPGMMEKVSKLLGDNKYLLGEKLCFVDFKIFECLERFLAFAPECLEPHSNLKKFCTTISELPGVAKYRASPSFQYIKNRFNNKVAAWGSGV